MITAFILVILILKDKLPQDELTTALYIGAVIGIFELSIELGGLLAILRH